jgi:hypothetical protein
MTNIITGEKIQQLCDIYLGIYGDFTFNPIISSQVGKHKDLNMINEPFDNPYKIFCYSHRIDLLANKICLFKNDFILITHNSDGKISETETILAILNSNRLIKWYGQNICFQHPKLQFIPIGIANSQWAHGNLSLFYDRNFMNNVSKTKKIYFNFNIATSPNKRKVCFDKLHNKLEWLSAIHPIENLKRLSTYEFCICPEGNGVDTHRLWECLYLNVVPIVIQSEFTDQLLKLNMPLVVLDCWENLDVTKLNYSDFDFNSRHLKNLLDFENLKSDMLMHQI